MGGGGDENGGREAELFVGSEISRIFRSRVRETLLFPVVVDVVAKIKLSRSKEGRLKEVSNVI